MMKQMFANFKKEFMLFTRTFRMLGICAVFFAFAVLDPLMISGMKAIAGWYDDVVSEVSEASDIDIDFNMSEMMTGLYGEETPASAGVAQALSEMTSLQLIIIMVLLGLAAGGEQKKRSIIMPECSGLRTTSYVLPKFVIYPVFVFLATIAALFIAYLTSMFLFPVHDIGAADVLLSGAFMGLYLAFFTALHLFIGISTGKPAFSSVFCIFASFLMPTIFSYLGFGDKYNPLALYNFAQYSISAGASGSSITDYYKADNLILSVAVTILIMLIFCVLTLFIRTARKIDNKGKANIF